MSFKSNTHNYETIKLHWFFRNVFFFVLKLYCLLQSLVPIIERWLFAWGAKRSIGSWIVYNRSFYSIGKIIALSLNLFDLGLVCLIFYLCRCRCPCARLSCNSLFSSHLFLSTNSKVSPLSNKEQWSNMFKYIYSIVFCFVLSHFDSYKTQFHLMRIH